MQGLASRKTAVEVLLKVEQEGAFANAALSAAFKKHSLTERDRAFVTYIVQGTLRHQIELDGEIKKFSKTKLEKLSVPVKLVLRSSLFQMMHMDDMPPSAVINTAVEIARKMGHEGSAKFVNGVLRSFERSRHTSTAAVSDETDHSIAGLSKRYSVPEWMLKHWFDRYGEGETLKLLQYSQQIPKLILRTCEMSITTDGLMDIFKSKGMNVETSELMPSCIVVVDRGPLGGPINKLPGYDDGLFAVQDDASALVSTVVEPQPGQTIIDLCAAPGGKSVHLGELMEGKGRVIAIDSSEKRLSLLGKERRRLGLQNIETLVTDGSEFQPDQLVDAVLVDAPCSGTGVLNRRSDLRVHRDEKDIAKLVHIQRSLLDNAAKMIKPGGVLVYSTCSLEKEENEDNLKWFVETHNNYKLDNLDPYFNKEILDRWSKEDHWSETQKQLQSGCIQLLPSRHGCSGFFISRLKREF